MLCCATMVTEAATSNLRGYSRKLCLAVTGGTTLSDTMHMLLHGRTLQSRSNREQHSILLWLRRRITGFWSALLKRLRSMFSEIGETEMRKHMTARSTSMAGSIGRRISEMDSELENAFWREGGPNGYRKPDSSVPDRRRQQKPARPCVDDNDLTNDRSSLYPVSSKPRHLGADPRHIGNSISRRKYADNLRSKKHGRQVRRIDSTSSYMTDEEYNALYKRGSDARGGSHVQNLLNKDNGKYNDNPTGDFTPITDHRKKEDIVGRNNFGNQEVECRPKRLSGSKMKNNVAETEEVVNVDGKWIQTVCFGSVWYSRSELDTAAEHRGLNRSRPTSRIPRLCCPPRKCFPKNH